MENHRHLFGRWERVNESKWAQHRMQSMCVFRESVWLLLLKMAKMNSFTKQVKRGESYFTPTLLPWRGCFCDKTPEVPYTQEAISSAVDTSWCCLTGWSLHPCRDEKQNAGSSSAEGAVWTHTGFLGHSFFRLRELWDLLHFFFHFYFLYTNLLLARMSVHHLCAWCHLGTGRGHWISLELELQVVSLRADARIEH